MNGLKAIEEIKKAVICFKAKANEMIVRLNTPWEVKMPNDLFGSAVVQYGDNKIVIDLSQLKTFEAVACDEDGNQATYVILGYKKDGA